MVGSDIATNSPKQVWATFPKNNSLSVLFAARLPIIWQQKEQIHTGIIATVIFPYGKNIVIGPIATCSDWRLTDDKQIKIFFLTTISIETD